MQRLFRVLHRRRVALGQMDALEMFGGDGSRHTLDYYRLVRSLDVWEVDAGLLAPLRENLPSARITIDDSFRQLQTTANTYDLIVIDAPGSLFGPQWKYCEHFEVFTPSLFRIVRSPAVIILNVVPELQQSQQARRSPPSPIQLSKRSAFYGTDRPELVPIEQMVATYRRITNAAGFELQWYFSLCRTLRSQLHYLAMKVGRCRQAANSPQN